MWLIELILIILPTYIISCIMYYKRFELEDNPSFTSNFMLYFYIAFIWQLYMLKGWYFDQAIILSK